MLKPYRHKSRIDPGKKLALLAILPAFLLLIGSSRIIEVETIQISAADSLVLVADEYIAEASNPYILLLHEQSSSRGDYSTIARRLCKMDYNCLALDMRNGGQNSYVPNETVRNMRNGEFNQGLEELQQDVRAALAYIAERSELPVILLGSGENASLAMIMALNEEHVRAAVALSPGEYFLPTLFIQDTITSLQKPLFITASSAEMPYVKELCSGIPEDYVDLFEPSEGTGERGWRAFDTSYEGSADYWVALILFFKDLI